MSEEAKIQKNKSGRLARFRISAELLISALQMPKDTEARNITMDDFYANTFMITVEHPDLPEVEHGNAIPLVTPQISEIRWDWGIEDE